MKKLFILLAFFAVTFTVNAQNIDSRFQDGVTHYIADQYLSAADSLHDMGIFFMRDNNRVPLDSLVFGISYEDSIAYSWVIQPLGIVGDGDTVTCFPGSAVADYQIGATAEGVDYLPWHVMKLATGGDVQYAKAIHVYIRIAAVGSEVASSKKRFNILPKAYRSAK